MNVKALLVDVGNTRVVAAAWSDRTDCPEAAAAPAVLADRPPLDILGQWPTPTARRSSTGLVEGLQALVKANGHPPVCLVSVVPDVTDLLVERCTARVMDHRVPLPFALGVERPEDVGPDRLANMAAACAAGLASALVVDCGTATTFDLLRDGVFVGGLIAPGPALAADALSLAAARLPAISFQPAPPGVGTGTETALSGGCWWVGLRGIQAVVQDLLDRHGELPVVVTGGLGGLVAAPGWHHDPSWTLRGVAVLAGLCDAS